MTDDQLYAMRHSLAHITAQAVQHLWPDAKFGVGPVVENGFYYDIDLGDTKISEDDFKRIEKEMRGIIARNLPFERSEKSIDEALAWATEAKQPYKTELLNDLKRAGTTIAKDLDAETLGVETDGDSAVESVSFYSDGDFTDLCRGPHAESTGKVGAFKLMRIAGAYWRGSEKNPQMQRLYGVAFATKDELEHYLKMLEEAKARDHKKLGRELELFFFHETSPGSAYWLPNGVIMYNELVRFWREEHAVRGYQEIVSPLINKKQLYQTSGHYDHYWDDMFTMETEDGEEYGLKPMNCPNAMVVFGHKARSYKELPLRLSDTDALHRYELSGTLNGLLRARGFRQDDAHIFVSEDQIEAEYERILEVTERFYSIFGLKYSFRLGTRP
ncbi:MAG TPA: threonine--tRNA ligase, partial [Candidatus Saccharimonadales bacterium]